MTPGLNDAGSSGIQLKIIDHLRSNLTSTRVKTGFHNLKGTVGLGSSENGQSIKHEHVRWCLCFNSFKELARVLTRSVPINSFTFYTISSGRVGCACHWREMLPAFGILSKWIQDGAGISLLEATWKATWSGPLVIQTLCSRLNSEILMERGQTERPTGKNSRLDGLRTEWKRRCGDHLQSHVLFHVLGREHAENSFCFVCDPDVQSCFRCCISPVFWQTRLAIFSWRCHWFPLLLVPGFYWSSQRYFPARQTSAINNISWFSTVGLLWLLPGTKFRRLQGFCLLASRMVV